MKRVDLLDAARLALLQRRLDALLPDAPAHGLLSITLDLGMTRHDWLDLDVEKSEATYWAQPGLASSRLALGRAMIFSTTGTARFSALQAAFAGIALAWLHDDNEHTGVVPAAHIGFAFAEESRDGWPNARLVVPAILLQNRAGHSTATFSCAVRDSANAIERWIDELRAMRISGDTAQVQAGELQRRANPLADRAFLARSRVALSDIATGHLEKIVLTRSVRFDAAQAIASAPLLAALTQRHPECTIYAIGLDGQSLVGATPESLVSLDNGVVRADALAGTAWLSAAPDSTRPGSLKLLDDKNSREQQLVVDAVRAALAPLCVSLAPPQKPEIMQLRELQHLRTCITGKVRDDVGLFDLIARLHPTPAVGGTPDTAARQWLHSHGDQRGAWYTGGIGWIDRNGNGEIAVALRCARIAGTQAELYAGAGIVAGSDPAQELAETEVKLGAMIAALHHAQALGNPACVRSESSKTGTP